MVMLEYLRAQNSAWPLQGCVLTTGVDDAVDVAVVVALVPLTPPVCPPTSNVRDCDEEVTVVVKLPDVVVELEVVVAECAPVLVTVCPSSRVIVVV